MSCDDTGSTLQGAQRLSATERAELLRLARLAIGAALGLAEPPELSLRTASLLEPGGAFVTLHLEGSLRGCIGTLQAHADPLYETVIRTARAAAFEDPRFPPLTPAESCHIHLEISRLSLPLKSTPEQVIAGVHGVQITRGPARALLLPQVARQRAWNSRRLLREVCRKAGLSEDAWQDTTTELTVFTAEVFGDGAPVRLDPAGKT
jgi:AmmeMemoRadiSam system protein A